MMEEKRGSKGGLDYWQRAISRIDLLIVVECPPPKDHPSALVEPCNQSAFVTRKFSRLLYKAMVHALFQIEWTGRIEKS